MKPKQHRPLKPTPTSSPLVKVRRLDLHGEPTHPELVREFEEHMYHDLDLSFGPCLCKTGVGVARAFWYWFNDGAQLGMVVRSDSYAAGAKAARAEFERCPWLTSNAKIVRLARVDVLDGLSETRQAVAALNPRTHW